MRRLFSALVVAIVAMTTATSALGGVVLSDSLNGSTIGTREGGTFTGGGWRVDGQYDSIRWHTGTYPRGAFEYNVTGLAPGSCPGGLGFKNELSHIYDWTWNNADIQYAPGYRDTPYKHFIRKQCEAGKVDTLELVWAVPGPPDNFIEPDTGALSWSSGTTYLFRTEWENAGGQAILRIFRDGGLVFQGSLPGSWAPAGQSVRIAASPRRADEGAAPGAIYSNIKVYDDQTSVPNAPSITAPASAETINTQVAYIQWSGDSHTRYQVRVNTQNNVDLGIVSDTGQVDSSRFFSWSGTLPNNTTCFAFVRLGNTSAWGAWSAARSFSVNTAFVPGGVDYVRVKGNSYVNNAGPFLGLGFTYMRAMYNCKFQRTRYTNDCAYMASKGYNYLRDLTMVDWDDLEIAPVSFTNSVGQAVAAWSDYWQQFRDHIDIAYSNGLKTEITIFAGAQAVMPSDSTRTTHINNILSNMPGREHKIVLIEIANEHYQNGLPDINDVRNKAAYIAGQTTIPVSLSSPSDTSDGGIFGMYSGSAADLCTVHFTRDISAPEGGWRPVRDGDRTIAGIAPLSSNEPIGAGSSVNTENDPLKLCMAGVYGWTANLISYVYHSRAGVFGWTGCCPPSGTEVFFSGSAGNDSYANILPLLPKELASWEKSDGKNSLSPFTNYCMGQANKWWTEVGGATNGCLRNISAVKNGRFVTTPISILGGGLQIQARRPMQFKAYNPLTGAISYDQTLASGASFTLAEGTGAYVIIGDYTDVPIDPGGGSGSSTEVTIDLGANNIENGMSNPIGGDGDNISAAIGGRDCRRNMDPGFNDWYFYFAVSDSYAFQGNKPTQYISVDYYDTGTTTLQLQYDATSEAFKQGPSITLTNTNTWKTVVWQVTDAYFGNRTNGSDFRIFGGTGPIFYLDIVKASINPPPNSPTCFVDNFVYPNSNLNGNEAWTGSATSQITVTGQTVRIDGGAGIVDAVRAVNCVDPGIGFVRIGVKVMRGVGADTMWGVWYDDPSGANLARWYGSGTSVRGRIGATASVTAPQTLTGGWDDLVVKIFTATNQTEFFFNGVSIGSLDHGQTGATDTVGRLRFERIDNSVAAGQNVFLDELRIKDTDSTAPGVASNPNPANGATGVAITAAVSWTAGSGATTHNVHFGTANPPPFIAGQAGTSYDPPGNLAAGTTYFWRIDEVNASGTTTGPVWSFTTLPLPGAASAPNPANGATLVSINVDPSWTAGSNATSHDVLFGTTNPPPFVVNQTGTTYNAPTLNPNTTYFWRIDEKNSSGTTTGTVWSFVTLPVPGQASSPSPASGATGVSTTTSVTWTAGSNTVSHNVHFGTSNPPTFQLNQAGTSYSPGVLAGSTTYFWRIDEVNGSGTTTGVVWSFTTGTPPPNPPCFSDSFAYANGNLNGNGSWGGSATSQITVSSQSVRINGGTGSADAVRVVNCGDPGTGTIRVAVSIRNGTGTNTMWSLWIDDASSLNLARWYGTGTTAKGRIGTTATVTADQTLTGGWDRLVVLINPTANTTQFFFNGASLGTFDHGVTGAGNAVERLRFERIDNVNAAGNIIDFDDLVIGDDPVVPPGQASGPSPANGATGVATNATLSWSAGSGAISHDVRFGTSNPPPFVQNQAGTTYNPGTLLNGTTYFWRIDEVNAGGTTTGTVWSFTTVAGGPDEFSNSPFTSNAESWNIVVWRAGTASNGTMAWISSGGNPGGNMRSTGAGNNNTDSCQREGGEINKLISTAGRSTIQVQYDARFETDQTAATCTGTCTANVLEGNCADKLAVYYSTAGTSGPWTLLETVAASSVTQNVWATRTLNLPAGADNQANLALRFRWQFNRTQDKGRLDNIKLIDLP